MLVPLAGLLAALAVAAPLSAMTSAATTIRADTSRYGRILFDGRGFVLYAFTADAKGKSRCTGACAKAWPPLVVRRAPEAGVGASGSLVGTTRRADGSLQATYAGRPLYYYVGDRKPHQILCQNVSEYGGLWLVIRPGGRLVR